MKKLVQMLDTREGGNYDFLGFTFDLQEGTIADKLCESTWTEQVEKLIPAILLHYSQGKRTNLAHKFVKFRGLPGGSAYEGAFIERAVKPVARAFAQRPGDLPRAAELIGGKTLTLGDYSAEITPLKEVPLTYILWASEEFPAAVSLIYDQSASRYLPTEDLAVLGELTTNRLLKAEILLTKSA